MRREKLFRAKYNSLDCRSLFKFYFFATRWRMKNDETGETADEWDFISSLSDVGALFVGRVYLWSCSFSLQRNKINKDWCNIISIVDNCCENERRNTSHVSILFRIWSEFYAVIFIPSFVFSCMKSKEISLESNDDFISGVAFIEHDCRSKWFIIGWLGIFNCSLWRQR